MEQILRAIRNAKCMGDLYAALSALSNETERVVSTCPLNEEEARLLAQYLADIRSLLHRMAGSEAGSGCNERDSAAERLAVLYGEIEGRVKEMRNDLAGTREEKQR
jgi:hypothetical protein